MAEPPDIYQFVAKRGRPCELPGPWQPFKGHPTFFQPPRDGNWLFEELQKAFSPAELLESHVVIERNGALSLDPELADPGSIIFAHRTGPDNKPASLILRGSCLRKRFWPFSMVLHNSSARSMMDQVGEQLLITFSTADMAVLWASGLPAAPAYGLANFSGKYIDRFCESLGLPRCANSQQRWTSFSFSPVPHKKELSPTPLVLVGWRPAALSGEDPVSLNKVEQHLRSLHSNLGISLNDFATWKPTIAELERVRFCVNTGTAADIHDALMDSLENSTKPLIEPARNNPATNYAEALAKWLSLQDQTLNRTDCQQAWDRLQKFQEQDLIQPLVRRAQETMDPVARNVAMALAEVSRVMHPHALQMATNHTKEIGRSSTKGTVPLPKEAFQQLLALADRVKGLAQVIQHHRNTNKRTTPAKTNPDK